jgi:integrase
MDKEEQDKMNWLIVNGPNKKKFVFNQTKTSKKLGSVIVKVSPSMNKILKPWLAVNDSKWLFPTNQTRESTSMTPSAFGKLVSRFFEKTTGKKLGITMLRTIYISNRFPQEENEERELVAKQMGHSSEQQGKYSKRSKKVEKVEKVEKVDEDEDEE